MKHSSEIATAWARRMGLAAVPLFEEGETPAPEQHHVLLDGGFGSFALSITDEPLSAQEHSANWSWSSDFPHHITVNNGKVTVVRWDRAAPEVLTLSSVEGQLDAFYKYLTLDRVQSNQGVVAHMLRVFREVRSLVAASELEDDRSIDAFLSVLAQVMANSLDGDAALDSIDTELLSLLPQDELQALTVDISNRRSSDHHLALIPSLAIRHAGSAIFQEAHFELLRASGLNLFGYRGPATSRRITRGGAHYTPPTIARSVVEQALENIPDLANRTHLVIADPACGSGVFLHEALRTLRRSAFSGHVTLVGRDISRPAVSMARFVTENALRDWSPRGGCDVDVRQSDSLLDDLPRSDVVLMNPPFISWLALNEEQRSQMHAVFGDQHRGRLDYSMAFVSRSLEALRPGGVIGTLLPASLLTLRTAEWWRRDLLDTADLRFLGSIGDYGLFTHAVVQVAIAVLRKHGRGVETQGYTTALVTSRRLTSIGNALRTLRLGKEVMEEDSGGTVYVFQVPSDDLKTRPTWRFTSPTVEAALKKTIAGGRAVPIGDVFDVRQGVRTGLKSVFLLDASEMRLLGRREQKWFRPAITSTSIRSGRVAPRYSVFYPYDECGLLIKTEEDLMRELPAYYERYLEPRRERLARRSSIVRTGRSDWWGLSERRAWALRSEPRLVSKYFGGPGGFAPDLEAQYVVVQGFAWFLKTRGDDDQEMLDQADRDAALQDTISAYVAVMNSSLFGRILRVYCPHVMGGQFDLSPRYVNRIPIPDLQAMAVDEWGSSLLQELVELGKQPRPRDRSWTWDVDRSVRRLYGLDIFDDLG